jgi:quercetin dioxygenase-like cupin family protein
MTGSVHVSAAGAGTEYAAPDATVTVKIGGEHSGGDYELFEVDAPRRPASPVHTEVWNKAFYVLQGRILVHAGDQGYELGPGASITVPAGTPNTFSVLTPSAKFLALSTTDGMGRFFADLDVTAGTDPAMLRAVTERHGVTIMEQV